MAYSVIGQSSTPIGDFIPCPSVPAGLTLRETHTSSNTPSKTGWPKWVYIVAVGGGGGGGGQMTGTINSGPGGGGAVIVYY